MKPDLIISGWNGTLITDMDDKPVLKQIAMDELAHAAKRPWLWGRAAQLANTKFKLDRMVKDYRDDPQSQADLLRATYALYNSDVINGIPMRRIRASVDRYADKAVDRLDPAFDEFCEAARYIQARMLTSALDDGARAVMGKKKEWGGVRFRNFHLYGSQIIRNDSVAESIDLRNYDDKAESLIGIVENIALDRKDRHEPLPVSVYLGDDFRDEPCAELVHRFVVAPLAADEYRQHMASKYGNKVRTPGRFEVFKALTMD
jgi:hypothetical protein